MASLADLPELVGFFSYSRDDDEDSHGALSAFRDRIQKELRGQLGRSKATFRLWQDTEMIASGTQWEAEIKKAVAQSVFFIPIITPTVVQSRYCRFELEAFLDRESALDRDDLVFPIIYIRVPGLEDDARQRSDPVLSIVGKRQWLDWRDFRHRDINSPDAKARIERFCQNICDALDRPWVSPEERKEKEEAAARQRAEAERGRQQAEAKRQEEERREQAEALTLARAEEEKRQRAAEAERQRADADRLRAKLEAERRADDERLKAEAEAKRLAEAEALRIEADAKRAAEQRLRAEEEARRKAEAQQRRAEWWAKTRERAQKPQFILGAFLICGALLFGAGVSLFGISPRVVSNSFVPGAIRYDGIYSASAADAGVSDALISYLRFYQDGTVVLARFYGSVSQTGINKDNNFARSSFLTQGNDIKFSLREYDDTVDYSGTIGDSSLSLSLYRHSNRRTTRASYKFQAW